jgi:mercuric ion binding protein
MQLRRKGIVRSKQVLITAVLLLSSGAATSAGINEVRLYVEGLACPFCTFGIEKSLKRVPGVSSLETTIGTGLVRIQMKPGVPLDPPALNEAIERSGFTPSRIEATITGRLSTDHEHPQFVSSGDGQVFRLVQPGSADSFEPLTAETLAKLTLATRGGSRLLAVSGRIHVLANPPPALAVENFEVVP